MGSSLIKNKILSYRSKIIIKIKNSNSFIQWLNNTDLESLRIWRNEQKNILRHRRSIYAIKDIKKN